MARKPSKPAAGRRPVGYNRGAMTGTVRKLLDDVLQLPENERLELASEIIASVDGPPDAGWTEAWLAELDRRVQAARERAESSPEWPEVQARILRRLAGP